MSNLKEIRDRIISIGSVMKTTEAMKMTSVLKLRKYKKNLLIYSKILNDLKSILYDLIIENLDQYNVFINSKYSLDIQKKLFIVFTSDKGLCGNYNSIIFYEINKLISQYYNECFFIPIGKKILHFLNKKKCNIFCQQNVSIKKLSNFIVDITLNSKNVFSIYVIYNNISNNIFNNQKTNVNKIFPIKIKKKENKYYKSLLLEGTFNENFEYILTNYINIVLKQVFTISKTSEYTSRMISMHKATENATDIKNELIKKYNKERQNYITKEILEIISGLETIKK